MSVKIGLTSRAGAAKLLGGGQGSFGHRDLEYRAATDLFLVIRWIRVTLSVNTTSTSR